MTFRAFEPESPEEEMRRRIRAQMVGSVAPQPSVTDQVFGSLNRAKDDLALRIQGLTQAPVEAPTTPPSFLQRLQGLIASPRFENAVAGISAALPAGTQSGDSFFGTAARAFTGGRQQRHQRELEDRAMAQRDAAVENRVGVPSDKRVTIQTARGPIELRPDGSWGYIAPEGTPLIPEKTPAVPRPDRPRNIDPLSPEGIAAAVERQKAVQGATQNPVQQQASSFGDRAKAGSDLLATTPTPSVAEFETGRRLSPSLRSDAYRLWRQAAEQFITAVLRKESGAAISDGEFARYQDIYIPTPGDSPELLARKKAAREREVNNLYRGGRTNEQTDPYQGLK